jgi:Chromosome segregation ATPases
VAAVLRQWLDNSGLRMDDIRSKLTPDHFKDGRVPGRSALSDRLAGVALRQDFIEAVADICSSSDAAQQQLLDEVRAARQRARTAGAGPSRSTVPEAQLVIVQQRSLEVSDRLLRALERQQQLERERNDANQMVLILLSMVDKLQRDITILNREHDRLRVSNPAEENVKQVYERLARSEQQRDTAETELARAKDERQKADQLAEEAAEQVRLLTEELERLRGEAPDATATAEAATTVPAVQAPPDVEADDIDLALSKAARHLDDRADRLDQLASELHLDNPPDNSLTSNDVPDNSQISEPDAVNLTPEQVVVQVRVLLTEDEADDNVEGLLHLAGQTLPVTEVLRAAILLRDTNLPDEAAQLLHAAISRTQPVEMPPLISTLRTRGQDAELYQLLNQVARHWPASDLTEVVTSLREEAQASDAYQVLSAVGRDCPPLEVLKVLARVAEHDANWVVDAACRDRPLDELPALEKVLRNLRKADAAKVAASHELRKMAASHKASIVPRPRPASLLESNYEDDGDYPLVRPYAMAGGHARRPSYSLPGETLVRTTAAPDQLSGLLPEHQRICNFCRDPHDVIAIADRLSIPLGVARILVADLAETGLVELHTDPAATRLAEIQVYPLTTAEAFPGLLEYRQLGPDTEEEDAPGVGARLNVREDAGEDELRHGDATLPPARQAFVDEVADQLIKPLFDAGWTNQRISAAMDRNISYATLRRISEGEYLPSPKTMEAVIELVGRQRQLSVEAHTRLMTAYLRALREADSALHDRYLEEDEEMRRLSAADSKQAAADRPET